MSTDVQARPRGLGVAGSIIGLLALIAVVVPQWLLPGIAPVRPAENVAVEKPHTLKERILQKLKLAPPKNAEARPEPHNWTERFQAAAIALALLSITLAVFSVIRREERLYAGVAAGLGAGALALQLAILFAGALIAILILYAVLNQSGEGFQPTAIVAGAAVILAIAAILLFGLASPGLALIVIGAAIVILAISSLLGGF